MVRKKGNRAGLEGRMKKRGKRREEKGHKSKFPSKFDLDSIGMDEIQRLFILKPGDGRILNFEGRKNDTAIVFLSYSVRGDRVNLVRYRDGNIRRDLELSEVEDYRAFEKLSVKGEIGEIEKLIEVYLRSYDG